MRRDLIFWWFARHSMRRHIRKWGPDAAEAALDRYHATGRETRGIPGWEPMFREEVAKIRAERRLRA